METDYKKIQFLCNIETELCCTITVPSLLIYNENNEIQNSVITQYFRWTTWNILYTPRGS